MAASSTLSISQIAKDGEALPCAGNLPVSLSDPECAWFIDSGSVDLFLMESRDGAPQAAPEHLLRAEAGRLLPGVAPDMDEGTHLEIIAKGKPGTVLKRLRISELGAVDSTELATQVDAWVQGVIEYLCRFSPNRPRPTALAEAGLTSDFDAGIVSARRGVVWLIQAPESQTTSPPHTGANLFLGVVDTAELGRAPRSLPLTHRSWLTVSERTRLAGESSATLAQQGALFPALASFHKIALATERLNRRLAVVDQANLEHARARTRESDETSARHRLFNIYDQPVAPDAKFADSAEQDAVRTQALLDALQLIGRREGIDFKLPQGSGHTDSTPSLTEILDASGVRARKVTLLPEDNWWLGDSQTMLAFRKSDGQPLVLLPGRLGRYRLIDPITKEGTSVTKQSVSALEAGAWMFYPPLPKASATPSDLWRIGIRGSASDLTRLVLTALASGLIKLAPALALGFLAHALVTGGSLGAVQVVVMGLAALGLIGGLLQLLQGAAMMRLEDRATSRIEAAFWDRLMRLPTSVLHRHPAGDLAMTGMTFQALRGGVQGVVADSVVSLICLLPVFLVIFLVDAMLGGVALAFSIASLTVTLLLGLRQRPPQARMMRAARSVVGRLFQVIDGIAKLRVTSAEGSAFSAWARDYREQKRAEFELGRFEGHVQAFGAALPFLAGAVLLLMVSLLGERPMPVADFLIIYFLFIVFQGSVARLGESIGALSATLPAIDQMRPLLSVEPETEAEGAPVEYLGGEILFDHISYRYSKGEPLVLDDVTIHARPGEFIAIAGPSGAGKSTLFRLALGLDKPTSGAVYYDGRDLEKLNLKQLRRKIGAVPQSVELHPQDLWDNIAAHHEHATSQEVWQMAEVADIQREIKAMPMGMMTPVGTGGSVLSGGESQRITIARSLMREPRVLLLDEATNWLDNDSQAQVMENLAALTSTRIVIAHRLSTLLQADRIYVVSAGKVVQHGTFQDLMEEEGEFRELVRRQIA